MFFYLKNMCLLLCSIILVVQGRTQTTIESKKTEIHIEKLHHLNSQYRETNVCISPTGDYLFWQSPRGGNSWSVNRQEADLHGMRSFDGDLWYAVKKEGKWSNPKSLQPPVNSSNNEDEPNVSPNGRYVYYQSWNKWDKTRGPYYRAEFKGAKWTNSRGLGSGIHAFFRKMMNTHNRAATDGATFSADGRTFIVAAGKDYTGKMDLYISKRNDEGEWSYPKPLSINTLEDERSVFLAGDGQSLYFASSGYGGMGGLDIFKVKMNRDGTFGEVINLGAPFNTEQDDYNFVLTASGNEAYFVRDGDIYFADLKSANEEIKPALTRIIRGKVTHPLTHKPLDADLLLRNREAKMAVRDKTHPNTGEYIFVVPNEDRSYELLVRAKGFPIDTFQIEVS